MKLHANGIPKDIQAILKTWPSARTTRVAVGGQFSRDMVRRDMVYQGTILGPPLWNVFYEDAAMAIHVHEFCEIVFADNLNAYEAFELTTADNVLL